MSLNPDTRMKLLYSLKFMPWVERQLIVEISVERFKTSYWVDKWNRLTLIYIVILKLWRFNLKSLKLSNIWPIINNNKFMCERFNLWNFLWHLNLIFISVPAWSSNAESIENADSILTQRKFIAENLPLIYTHRNISVHF